MIIASLAYSHFPCEGESISFVNVIDCYMEQCHLFLLTISPEKISGDVSRSRHSLSVINLTGTSKEKSQDEMQWVIKFCTVSDVVWQVFSSYKFRQEYCAVESNWRSLQ